jgi:uncharacterized protein (TIGR02466 family)
MPNLNTLLPAAELMEPFAATMMKYQWPNTEQLNADLKRVILERTKERLGYAHSNVGGLQSEHDMQDWPEACVKDLLQRIDTMIRELILRTVDNPSEQHLEGWRSEVWANVNRPGGFNRSHSHTRDNNLWSGIYYVEPGVGPDGRAESAGGHTHFEDHTGVPIVLGPDGQPVLRDFSIQPRPGLMVLFPGHLRHHVDPYLGQDVRITVAFNMRHHAFTVPSVAGQQYGETDWMWKNFRGVMIAANHGRNTVRRVLGRT